MKNKRKIVIISSIVIGVLVLTLGITYSIFTFNAVGKNSNLVVGDIYMHYNEPSQGLTLSNARPLSEYRVDVNKIQTCVDYLTENGLSANSYFVVSKETYQNCTNRYNEYIFNLREQYGGNDFPSLPLSWYCPALTYDDYCSGKTLTYQGPSNLLEDGGIREEELEELTNNYLLYGEEFQQETIQIFDIVEDYKNRRDRGNLTQDDKTYLKDNGIIVTDLPGTSYFEFTVDGKNTHATDAINYRIWLSLGNNRSSTRIADKFLTFKLTEVNNGVETVLKDNLKFETIENSTVYYDIVPANTTSEIVKTYRLYMWLNDDVKVCGGELTDDCDYTVAEWNNAYASVKVNVNGEYQKSANFAQYIKSRYNGSKQDGIVAINTEGYQASSGDTIREYRYNGIGNYCTYPSPYLYGTNSQTGEEEKWSVLDNICPQNVSTNIVTSTRLSAQNDFFASGLEGPAYGMIKESGNPYPVSVNTKNNQITPIDSGLRNYITFNNEMWRIIGVFNEENADGVKEERIRIVKDDPLLASYDAPKTITKNGVTYTIFNNTYSGHSNNGTPKYKYFYWNNPDSNYTGNLNDWTKSGLMYYLNDNYLNSLSDAALIENMKYYLDGYLNSEYASGAYNEERGINQETKTDPWSGKVALLYGSDILYATDTYSMRDQNSANNNWLINNDVVSGFWLLSKVGETEEESKNTMQIVNNGDVAGTESTSPRLDYSEVNQYRAFKVSPAVRPVVTLKANIVVAAGDGSINNPYRIKTN